MEDFWTMSRSAWRSMSRNRGRQHESSENSARGSLFFSPNHRGGTHSRSFGPQEIRRNSWNQKTKQGAFAMHMPVPNYGNGAESNAE